MKMYLKSSPDDSVQGMSLNLLGKEDAGYGQFPAPVL